MGKGIDAARLNSPEHAALLDDLKDQLLIVFLKRLGGKLIVPVTEIDDTGNDLFAFRVDMDTRDFHFELLKKS
jgi:hypothetical protein